ncbi:hypothetical protein ANO11243_024300 [Dothideomycetidae sp. 11243]|nr:hypothetical protein ANO11243_024300 [fungal sp. No.11243]
MPSIPLHPPARDDTNTLHNPLPGLLQTPSGLAIIELQGTLHFPTGEGDDDDMTRDGKRQKLSHIPVGKLVFPLHDSTAPDDKAWMKRVYLYVGRNQRMTGEVKTLAKPLAVMRRREVEGEAGTTEEQGEELEIVEVVQHKIVFASRPEPVGTMEGATEDPE